MSDIERVVKCTRKLETLLREQYHAEGKGLHQLVTSCQQRLPRHIIGKLRFIATVRNKIVHDDHYKLDDRAEFMSAFKECQRELTPRSGRFVWRLAVSLMMLMTLAAIVVYYAHWDLLDKHFFSH